MSEVQRARLLGAATRVVSRYGYEGMSVARVAGGARVSRRTFYELFEDREDCFLAVFQEALARLTGRIAGAYDQGGGASWRERVRSALSELLVFFDEDPAVASLLVVDALGAGPRVLECRARALRQVSAFLQEHGSRAAGVKAGSGAAGARAGSGPEGAQAAAPLTGEGVTGAVFGVIYSRISEGGTEMMLELLNPLMAIVVLPYLGPAAARKELERPARAGERDDAADGLAGRNGRRAVGRSGRAPGHADRGGPASSPSAHDAAGRARGRAAAADRVTSPGEPDAGDGRPGGRAHAASTPDPLAGLPMRITYRTLCVLGALAEHPGASNRAVGDTAGVHDQGQISKLLARLHKLGLIHNTTAGRDRGHPSGEPNQWHLTPRGEQVERALRVPAFERSQYEVEGRVSQSDPASRGQAARDQAARDQALSLEGGLGAGDGRRRKR